MKDRDLIYIGVIGVSAYLLLKKNSKEQVTTTVDPKANPVGNATNGGLNLPPNMDLPNLTATPPNGLPTEVALNNSYVQPLIKDDTPTQIFGSYNLPTPYNSGVNITSPSQIQDIISSPEVATPIVVNQTPTLVSDLAPVRDTETVVTSPTPVYTGGSVIGEPVFPVKNLTAELSTEAPIMAEPKMQSAIDDILAQCGTSFSIPNNDKEGSYTNYWYDGKEFYTQTTSPMIRTIAVKISADAYLEGCKKYQMFQLQNSNKV